MKRLFLFSGLGLLLIVAVWSWRISSVPAPSSAMPSPPAIPSKSTSETSSPTLDPPLHVQEVQLRTRLSKAPEDTLHLFQLAVLLVQKGAFDEAATYFEKYLKLHPTGRQAYLELAQIYSTKQQWQQAADVMKRMLEYFPDDAAALYNLGAILANQGNIKEAQQYWHKVLQLPGDTEAHRLARTSLKKLVGMTS